jgi:hypothetical protein
VGNVLKSNRYRVDRQKSVDVLKCFLDEKDDKLEKERKWLTDIKVDCILSDAAFLGWFVPLYFSISEP